MINQQLKKQNSKDQQSKVQLCKDIIEQKYNKIKKDASNSALNQQLLTERVLKMNLSQLEEKELKSEITKRQSENLRKQRQKININQFESIAIIGRGAFGEVRLCKYKDEIVAVKKMKKNDMIKKNQTDHCKAERDILAQSNNPWIVDLKYSFQDNDNLYLIMEYLPGGDLMTLLIKKEILTEKETQFYAAECLLAIESIHKMNVTHRDLKPDNILIDKYGHIKLSDFGLCKFLDDQPVELKSFQRHRKKAYSTVGTPDYIAPEVFSQNGYTHTVDYWSLGVIIFEMIVGFPPFYSDDQQTTCKKIINWQNNFSIPKDAQLSYYATDLINRLICCPSKRLGNNGINEIKQHPFFNGIDWNRQRSKKAPFIPEVTNDLDTQNFDKFDEQEPWHQKKIQNKINMENHFVGYTYKRDQQNERQILINALENFQQQKSHRQLINKTNIEKKNQVEINMSAINASRVTETERNQLENFKNIYNYKNNFQNKIQNTPYMFGNQIKDEKKGLNQLIDQYQEKYNQNYNQNLYESKNENNHQIDYRSQIENKYNNQIQFDNKNNYQSEKNEILKQNFLYNNQGDTNKYQIEKQNQFQYEKQNQFQQEKQNYMNFYINKNQGQNDYKNFEKAQISNRDNFDKNQQNNLTPRLLNINNYLQKDIKFNKIDDKDKIFKGDQSERNIQKKLEIQRELNLINKYQDKSQIQKQNIYKNEFIQEETDDVNRYNSQKNNFMNNVIPQKKIQDYKFTNFHNIDHKNKDQQQYQLYKIIKPDQDLSKRY